MNDKFGGLRKEDMSNIGLDGSHHAGMKQRTTDALWPLKSTGHD